MELLRIVAMVLVLVVHACDASFGAPAKMQIAETPLISTVKLFMESIVIVCVNLFVLLSGWYGIKAKKNSLLKFRKRRKTFRFPRLCPLRTFYRRCLSTTCS